MNPELRKELDSIMPYDSVLPGMDGMPVNMSSFAINNVVFTLQYSNALGETPFANMRYLAGGPLGNMLRFSDTDVHFYTKLRINSMNVVIILHSHQCIICGVRSYLVLLVVCNLITKHLRKHMPVFATMYFSSFISQMQNSVCRMTLDIPLNFDRLQDIVRPAFKVTKMQSDKEMPSLFSALNNSRRRKIASNRRRPNNLKINHHELKFFIPQSHCQRKVVEAVIKFYHSGNKSIICINGVHSIYLAHQLLCDMGAFLYKHRATLHAAMRGHTSNSATSHNEDATKRNISKLLLRVNQTRPAMFK